MTRFFIYMFLGVELCIEFPLVPSGTQLKGNDLYNGTMALWQSSTDHVFCTAYGIERVDKYISDAIHK